jgi:hypothetical protein
MVFGAIEVALRGGDDSIRSNLPNLEATASGCQNKLLVDLPYLCFVPDWRAVAR